MARLVISDLEDEIAARLRARAEAHGRSPEQEASKIIGAAVGSARRENPADVARELFGPENGVHLDLPPREETEPPPFS
jgi:plasmid stability protein